MKDIKNNFSNKAGNYAAYRPLYPPQLYSFLLSLVEHRRAAWDCGTGNGQVAFQLSTFFDKVFATDISREQISAAVKKSNIDYSVQRAEDTCFANNSFDLVTVAQAIHWFDFDAFYREVNRCIRPGGILAVIGYGLISINKPIDAVIRHFYGDVVGAYWDEERKYIDENYATIPFPFNEIDAPSITNTLQWTPGELTGYLQTWSAVKHYQQAKKADPVQSIYSELQKVWPAGTKKMVSFPLLLRVAKIQ